MRIFKLDGMLSAVLYRVLQKGQRGQGYTPGTLREIKPLLEHIENHFQNDGLSVETVISYSLEENIFDTINKTIKSSSGWTGTKLDRKILDLEDFLKTVPSLSEENKNASK